VVFITVALSLPCVGLGKFTDDLWEIGVRNVAGLSDRAITDVEHLTSKGFKVGFHLKQLHGLAASLSTEAAVEPVSYLTAASKKPPSVKVADGGNGSASGAILDTSLPRSKKVFLFTHVVIDGRGCLVGKGDKNFSASLFMDSLRDSLQMAGAEASRVRTLNNNESIIIECACGSITPVDTPVSSRMSSAWP